MDLDSPIVRVVSSLLLGVSLLALSRLAQRLRDPLRGLLRLSVADVSFTEIFGVFFIGYAVAGLILGPDPDTTAGSRPRPVGFGGRFGFLRGGGASAVAVGFGLAFIWFLYRFDVLGKLSNPPSHRALASIIGAVAVAAEDIPAGGNGLITFHDPTGNRVGIVATSDTAVAHGTRVRIVGTRGLNPIVVPEPPVGAMPQT
jgi:hypothetical protein